MERLDATTHAPNIAQALAYRGKIDQSFAWLDRAYQQRDSSLIGIKFDPLLKSGRGPEPTVCHRPEGCATR
jgi:hypothetical protein